jgi:tellurite resistance protein TerC
MNQVWLWVVFNLFVLAMLALDLGVFHRKDHVIGIRESLVWSVIWVAVALLFNLGIYLLRGSEPGLEFLTGYLIERSLSIDNIFVFLLVFSYFKVPGVLQYRVLFYGIIGALIMRAIFIAAGVTLIQSVHWIIYVFGAFLILTGIKMALEKDKEVHPEKNPVLRLFRRFASVTDQYEGTRFFVRRNGKLLATPLFLVLLVIETTDVVFATDSIPAILAVTQDAFIVYSSNVFAILGLRALYFALAGIMEMFHHLHYGLSAVLGFVGAKMLLSDLLHVPTPVALGVIALILVVSIIASIAFPKPKQTPTGTT